MRIGQITYCYRPIRGGQEVYVENLRRVFHRAGHRNRVYQPNWGEQGEDTQTFPRIPKLGYFIPWINYYTFNAVVRALGMRSLREDDVIIAHYAFFSRPVWELAHRVIVLSHGVEWYPDSRHWNDRVRERVARRAFDRFTTVANDTHYFRHMGMDIPPAERFFEEIAPGKWFIPNCVDTGVYKPRETPRHLRERRYILLPRQLSPDRGIDLAIDAFALLARDNPKLELVIAGGPMGTSYHRECLAQVSARELEGRVEFTGYVPNADMPGYYAGAQVTLVPTRRREGTSLSALESMACGTPTVSTDVVGLRDLPTLKAATDAGDLADKMVYAMKKGDRVARAQRQAVGETFNAHNWAKAWLRVVEEKTGI